MAVLLFALAVCGTAMAVMLYTDRGSKRGCGRGCASCGNRELCHKRRGIQDKKK